MPSASSCLLHVFGFAEYPYQTESKRDKNGRSLFLENMENLEGKSTRTSARGGHEAGPPPGRAILPRVPLRHRLMLVPLPKIHIYSKKISGRFYSVWTPFDMDILRNKKHATNRNWHWALDQYVSPKK